MTSSRHKAREVAIQALYEVDSTSHKAEEVVSHLLREKVLDEEHAAFARELITGVLANKADIDAKITTFAKVWPLPQMSAIDRSILRLAIFEVLINNKVPVKVAINEAVELAKTFGSESSPKFINGVLGAVSALTNR
jgi:N utilization substance protein B